MAQSVLAVFKLLKEAMGVYTELPKEVADMKDKLEAIQAFIYDEVREDNQETDGAHKSKAVLVEELADICFGMEDLIDKYTMLEEQQPGDPKCTAFICDPICNLMERTSLRHQIRRAVEDKRIQEAFQVDWKPSCSRENQDVLWQKRQAAPLFRDEAEIIGFSAPRHQVIDWLLDERKERTVISVVGMGGVGKTTLAKSIFDSQEVTRHFECCAWVSVTDSYATESLLRNMLHQFYKAERKYPPRKTFYMDRWSLIEELRSFLQKKRYVIFFDDVWDSYFWDEIEFVAIDNHLGSRIFITTRNMMVAHSFKKSSSVDVLELGLLSKQESLELFYRKVFRSNETMPEELIGISRGFVEKCQGNPLAIVTVAGLLSTVENTRVEFERLLGELNLKFRLYSSFMSYIIPIISFSYYNLPYHLKPCFLYFGMYPEDHVVEKTKLIDQWIAEGFIKPEMGRTLEEIAELYLIELVERNLVQVSSLTRKGKIKGCSVHNLLRDMILSKYGHLKFCHYINPYEDIYEPGIRRISASTNFIHSMGCIGSSPVRSLFFFTNEELSQYFLSEIFTKCKLLKILDFENAPLDYVPENLGKLLYLKYLSLKNTQVKSLPKSIGLLQNLETLDLRQTFVHEMPEEIRKLQKLRHLLGENMSLNALRDRIGGMTSLETLNEVDVDGDNGVELIRELQFLCKMRKLGLTNVGIEHGSAICSSIKKMGRLEKLYISTKYDDGIIELLDFMSNPDCHLEKLCLRGKLTKLPESIRGFNNLVHLILSGSKLLDDPLELLQDLPELLVLSITNEGYVGKALCFEKEQFRKLKVLELRSLSHLTFFIIHYGALYSLKKLELENIPQLQIPSGIHDLENLQVLSFQNMPTEFEQGIHEVVPRPTIIKRCS